MNLKIACIKPNQCSFDCLNCPFELDKQFDKMYKEIIENDKNNKET